MSKLKVPHGVSKFFSGLANSLRMGEVGGVFVVKIEAAKRRAEVVTESQSQAQAYKKGDDKKLGEDEVGFFWRDGNGKSKHHALLAATQHCTKLNEAFKAAVRSEAKQS